nr:glycine-rich protein [Tanacetum cinerariifolium]
MLCQVRTVTIPLTGTVSTSRMGYTRGVGKGHLLSNEIGNEGSYGGTAGHGFYNDTCIEGGLLHSDAELPCQLGSGGGNDSTTNSGVLEEALAGPSAPIGHIPELFMM